MNLPVELAGKYELVDWVGGSRQWFGSRFRTVDLDTLNEKQAESLIKKGFPRLRRKDAKPTTAKSDKQ